MKLPQYARLQRRDKDTEKASGKTETSPSVTQRLGLAQILSCVQPGRKGKPVLFTQLSGASLNQLGSQALLTTSSPSGGVSKAIIWQFRAIRQTQDVNSFKDLDWAAKPRGGMNATCLLMLCIHHGSRNMSILQHLKPKSTTRPCSGRSPITKGFSTFTASQPSQPSLPEPSSGPHPSQSQPGDACFSSFTSFPKGFPRTQNPTSFIWSRVTRAEPSVGQGEQEAGISTTRRNKIKD